MIISALTPTQRKQIESLFCDSAFATDPADYLYELDRHGVVSGRTPINQICIRLGKIRIVNAWHTSAPGDQIVMDAICNTLARATLTNEQAACPVVVAGGEVPAGRLSFQSQED
jgi:hypothetical protein